MRTKLLTPTIMILALLLVPRSVLGGYAIATSGSSGPEFGVPSGNGTLTLDAFSQQTAPNPVGPNAVTSDSGTGGAAGGVPGSIGVGMVNPRSLLHGITYTPLVGVVGAPKAGTRIVTSTSGGANGLASYIPAGTPGIPAGQLYANATVNDNISGSAAARAIDPYTVPPGTYNYQYTIASISLQVDTVGGFAGVDFFADDSRFTSPLWSLSIVANGPITSISDLGFDFTSNAILNLNDALITTQLEAAFTISGGTASLASFQLFSTLYSVDQSITFDEGVDAGAVSLAAMVPEPSSLILLGLGLPCLLASVTRKWITQWYNQRMMLRRIAR